MFMLLVIGLAHAAGIHAGIPVHGVPDVTDPSFQTPELGWTAALPGGWARLYVGKDEADTSRWYQQQLGTLQLPAPVATGLGDECAGDADALFAFRDGNVGVLVRVDHGARTWAERLYAAIVDGPAWPAPPTLARSADGAWQVNLTGVAHVEATGGLPIPFRPGAYRTTPEQIIVWDEYGRPAILRP